MKQMKKLIFVCMLSIFSMGAFAQTVQGESSLGLNFGYGFDSENAIIGVDYRYNFTDAVRLAPSLSYFIKKDNLSAWAFDLNLHYVVRVTDMFGFYPLAGLDLSFWKHKYEEVNVSGSRIDVSRDRTRFGVNLGLGGEVYASDQFSIGLEIKYNIIKDYDQAILGLRLGYNF